MVCCFEVAELRKGVTSLFALGAMVPPWHELSNIGDLAKSDNLGISEGLEGVLANDVAVQGRRYLGISWLLW